MTHIVWVYMMINLESLYYLYYDNLVPDPFT